MIKKPKLTTIGAAMASVVLIMLLAPLSSAATQPTVTKITVENCQYPAGTVRHAENVESTFENTLDSVLYGDWDNSNTDDNCVSGLGTTENIIYAGKNDNTGNFDNVEWVLSVPFNENLEIAKLNFRYKTEDNVEAVKIYLKCLVENTDGENIQLGSTLDITTKSDWYSFGLADFTDKVTTAGTYRIKLRTEMQDTGGEGATPNIRVWFDNFVLETKYRGSSDNIEISQVNFSYTENSLTSAGTINLFIEENFTVCADNSVDVEFEFDPFATGKTWDNVSVNGVVQSYDESNENVRWTFSVTKDQEENVELTYHASITFENWSTAQTSSQHRIAVDDNVEYTASVGIASDSPLDNLCVTISLPDPSTLGNTENVKVSDSYVETSASGENLTFTITKVENENTFTVLYSQSPATYVFNGVTDLNAYTRRYSWTFTNPTSNHVFENSKFTTTVDELTQLVQGTDEVKWGTTTLSSSQYSIANSTFSIDPDLNPGDTGLTLDFERQHTLYIPPSITLPEEEVVPAAVPEEEEVPPEVPIEISPQAIIAIVILGFIAAAMVTKRMRWW